MAYNNSGSDTEVTSCSKECVESYAKLKKLYDEQREQLGDASIEIKSYTLALKKVEAQLVCHQQNQLAYEEKIRFMKINLDDITDVLTYHKKLLAEVVKEKEELKTKLENFQSSSKGLSKLLNSQMSTRDKSGLGYGNQVHNGVLSYENEVFQSVFDSRSCDVKDSHVHDRFENVEGMHAIPPPMIGNYMPSGPDREVDDSMFTYGPKQSKTSESDNQTSNFDSCESISNVETLESVLEPVVVEPKVVSQPKVWSDAPMIKEYESDSDDEYVIQPSKEQERPSFAFVNTVKHVKTPRETVKEQNTYSPSPKADKRDWNGLMSKRLGLGYGFTKKACFVCGSFSHLIRDCDFHEKRMAKQVELNKKKVNTARQNLSSHAISTSAARKVNAVRPIMCNKKNKVLFTDTEYLVLYSDFKLPNENQVLLRIPKQNNMYSFNLKNIVPSGGLACLIAKATVDESNKWHRRLGHHARSDNQANKTAGPEEANHSACTKDNIDAGYSAKEADPAQDYFVLPIYFSYTSTDKSSEAKNEDEKHTKDTCLKTNEEPVDQEDQAFLEEIERLKRQEKEANDAVEVLRKEFAQSTEDLLLQAGAARATSTNTVNTVSTPFSTANPSNFFSTDGPSNPNLTNYADQDDSQIPALEDIYGNSNDGVFTNASYGDEGAMADITNLESTVNVSPIPTSSIHSIQPTTQILGDPKSAVQTRSKVWILVYLPYGKKAIRTKWVYMNKQNERGVVVRNKARLVAQGHRQEEGIDYDEARVKTESVVIVISFYLLPFLFASLSRSSGRTSFAKSTVNGASGSGNTATSHYHTWLSALISKKTRRLRRRANWAACQEFSVSVPSHAGFLGQAAGTAEEQAKNFRWGLHKSILDRVLCMEFNVLLKQRRSDKRPKEWWTSSGRSLSRIVSGVMTWRKDRHGFGQAGPVVVPRQKQGTIEGYTLPSLHNVDPVDTLRRVSSCEALFPNFKTLFPEELPGGIQPFAISCERVRSLFGSTVERSASLEIKPALVYRTILTLPSGSGDFRFIVMLQRKFSRESNVVADARTRLCCVPEILPSEVFVGPITTEIQRKLSLSWVVVDRLDQDNAFSSLFRKVFPSVRLAEIFLQEIVRDLHGISSAIAIDRDPPFTSRFGKGLQKSLGNQAQGQYGIFIKDRRDSLNCAPLRCFTGRKCRASICLEIKLVSGLLSGQRCLGVVLNEKVDVAREKLEEAQTDREMIYLNGRAESHLDRQVRVMRNKDIPFVKIPLEESSVREEALGKRGVYTDFLSSIFCHDLGMFFSVYHVSNYEDEFFF
ncbi:ribonuclease H-like domain-containing protein [Tanacetum coccineum]